MATFTGSLHASALSMALLVTAGCVSVPKPIPLAAPADITIDTSQIFSPDLKDAYSYAERVKLAMVDHTQKSLDNRAATRSLIVAGTIGTVFATSFGGGRDLITGFAIGTGAVTGISSLTGERGYVGIYAAGADAAGCVSMSIVQVDAPGKEVSTGSDTLEAQRDYLDQLQNETSSAGGTVASQFDAAARARVDALNGEIARGLALANGYSTSTSTFAGDANTATKGIDDTVRRQIVLADANTDAFRAIVGQLNGLTTAPTPKPATAPAAAALPPPPVARPATTPAQALARLTAIETQVAATNSRLQTIISAAQTSSNRILASCAGKQPEVVVPPLAIAGAPGNTVTLKPGGQVVLSASGGLGGVSADWLGAVPDKLHITNGAGSLGQTIRLAADTPATNGDFTLRFHDFANPPQAIDITVHLAN